MKNTIRLTDRFIRSVKPSAKVIDYPDKIQTGLSLRVWPSGKSTWSIRYWRAGKSVRTAAGQWPEVTLAEAREIAAEARRANRRGQDPREVIRPPEVEADENRTLKSVASEWLTDQRARRRRSAALRYRLLELHVFDQLGDKAIEDITRTDIADLLVSLRDQKGLGSQVNRVHTVLSGIFTLALNKGLLEAHPMARMPRWVEESERETLLTLDELVSLWQAAEGVRSISGGIVRLLILLVCRREEVAGMRWIELDLEDTQWKLPGQRTKSKRDRTIPLSPTALQIIQAQPRGRGAYVFSATGGKKHFAGWRRAAELLRKEAALSVDWTFHDIRRSVVTIMGDDLRVPEETVARILDHSERARRGVTATYDKSKRIATIADALSAWERLLLGAVMGSDNVVSLPTDRSRVESAGSTG